MVERQAAVQSWTRSARMVLAAAFAVLLGLGSAAVAGGLFYAKAAEAEERAEALEGELAAAEERLDEAESAGGTGSLLEWTQDCEPLDEAEWSDLAEMEPGDCYTPCEFEKTADGSPIMDCPTFEEFESEELPDCEDLDESAEPGEMTMCLGEPGSGPEVEPGPVDCEELKEEFGEDFVCA